MKTFKLVIIFLVVGQIFSTPLMRMCDVADTSMQMECCAPTDCECDSELDEKMDAIKKQVKTASLDFHFDYSLNSGSLTIVEIDFVDDILNEYNSHTIILSSREIRTKLQVFIL
jgi:hypothetical protein